MENIQSNSFVKMKIRCIFFIIYFSGIARGKELEPFTNSNTYKYLNYIQNDKYLADAFRTAYVLFKYFLQYVSGLNANERLKIQNVDGINIYYFRLWLF